MAEFPKKAFRKKMIWSRAAVYRKKILQSTGSFLLWIRRTGIVPSGVRPAGSACDARSSNAHYARIASAMPPAAHSLCQNCICDAARRALPMPELRLRCGARRHHQSPCASGRTVVFGRPDFSEAKSAFPLHPRRRFRCRGCLLPMESGLRRQRL